MKKSILFALFFLLSLTKLSAQSNTVAAGGEATGSGGTASFTAGEVFYTYKSGSTASVTEGVQQSYLVLPTGVISGDATVCAGSSTQLSIALTGQGPWSGTLSDGTVFSGSDNPLLVSVTPTITTTYTIATLSNQTDPANASDLSGSATVMVYVAPSIATISPFNGTSGSTITIFGNNFDGDIAPTVTIGGLSMQIISLTSTSIQVTLPEGTCGGDIVVTNSCGVSSNLVPYSYAAPTAGITNNTNETELTCTTTTISVTATGGTSYSWSGGTSPTTAENSFTAAGTYTVTVTNADGCTDTASITITEDATVPTAAITNNTATTELTCNTTAISVTATGAGTYSWSDGSSEVATTATLSITASGTYTVTVTNANGCTDTASITITEDVTVPTAGITNNTNATVLTCTTTAISLTATGKGTYSWSDGSSEVATTATLSITEAGTYTVTVVNANGCTDTASITITEDATVPKAGITNNTGTETLTYTTTAISVTATGGTSYSWSGGTTLTTAANSFTTPGIYTVTVTNANGCTDTASITIKAKVKITAEDKSKVYGEGNPSLTFTYSGLVNGDTKITNEPSIATIAAVNSSVGEYVITLIGGSDANYEIELVNATLKIGKKDLTIIADDKSKVYGEANPDLTYSYSGFVNGDTELSTEPSINTIAAQSSNAGDYPITLIGGSDDNYEIELKAGTLTVGKANVTITADKKQKVYGEANPTLTFTYTGLVNGDTKVTTESSIATTATASSNVGTYPIALTGGSDANYDITLVAGELEVTQATLTITANEGQSKIFGTADLAFSYIASGFAAGDDKQVLTGTLKRDAGEAVGIYPINLGSLAAGGNYQIVYISADFEIIPAVIESVMQPAPIETIWGVYPELPSTVTVMTTDGQFLALPITWDLQTLYVFGKGEYPLSATITLPTGILNTEALTVEIVVTVLPKPAPEDILLDNNSFEAKAGQNFVAVGNLTVLDPIDNQHDISLADLAFDNGYFQINNGTLFWSSEERADGRITFKILVRVQDRDGNILEKEFTVIRNRILVSNIEIYNAFTPNGDNVNDTWGVEELRFYKGVRIQVFERSGKRLFYTENPDERWDGTYNGKELPIGTYYWTIEVGETGEVRKGMLNLLRK